MVSSFGREFDSPQVHYKKRMYNFNLFAYEKKSFNVNSIDWDDCYVMF